jgi:hypothetical protein
MPVFNGEGHLREAVESILRQTYPDFELIAIDDGSTDRSAEILKSYRDPRLRVLHNRTNRGLVETRNRGIQESQAEFIAWLDCDDTSQPKRLDTQVRLFDSHPEIGICGTRVRTIGAAPGAVWRSPTDPAFARCRFLFDNPLATSSVMLRRRLLIERDLSFNPRFPMAEDYDLWERLAWHCGVTNLPNVLTCYREHDRQISRARAEEMNELVWRIQARQLETLGLVPTAEERQLHTMIGVEWRSRGTVEFAEGAAAWLEKLASANDRAQCFPKAAFLAVLGERWFFVCATLASARFQGWKVFRSSGLSHHVSWRQRTRAFVRSASVGLRPLPGAESRRW